MLKENWKLIIGILLLSPIWVFVGCYCIAGILIFLKPPMLFGTILSIIMTCGVLFICFWQVDREKTKREEKKEEQMLRG